MALSTQLERLAQQAKELEQSAAVMRTENVAKLHERRTALAGQFDAFRSRVKADVAATGQAAEAAVLTAQQGFRDDLEASRKDAMARRHARIVDRADHRADRAEADAADAIEYAAFVLREAEYVVLAAADARAESEERAAAPVGGAAG